MDKLMKKIKSNPQNVRFKDLQKLLENHGYTTRQPRGGSSHYVFTKKGCDSMVIPNPLYSQI
jgi:predicted RNA binding protein YcfA (HicA-like mRNA interferase family)